MTLRKSLLFTALVLTGCGRGVATESEFRSGLPTKEMVQVKSPDTQSTGIGQRQSRLSSGEVNALAQNQESSFYELTRGATAIVNGSTLAVLGLVNGVTQYTPTSISGETAVWGPHSEALQKNSWKLSVTRTADNTYSYTLSAKDKNDANADFVDVLTGSQTAAVDDKGDALAGFGHGQFTLNWDKIATLPDHDANVGSLTVTYARPDATSAVTVAAHFSQIKDDNDPSKRIDVDYGYASTPGQGGQFDFKEIADAYHPAGSSKLETLTIRSRWQETGAGRSDIKLAGGDLPGEATVNDCWDTHFLSQFMRTSYDPFNKDTNYGTEATSCAFTSADYSSL